MRVETVDADHRGLGAPVDLVQPGDDILAGLLLVVGGDGILDVENYNVRGRLGDLFEQSRSGPRNREFGAMQARCCLLDDREAHSLAPLFLPLMAAARFSRWRQGRWRCN